MKTRTRYRLGEMLIEADLLTHEQLELALREQKKAGLRLGQYLIRYSICREQDVVGVISRQLRIEQYSPEKYPIHGELAKQLPSKISQKYGVVPLADNGTVFTVAMVDPLDIDAVDAVETYLDSEVETVICTEAEYNQLYSSVYGMFSGFEGAMEGFENLVAAAVMPSITEFQIETGDQEAVEPIIRLINLLLLQAVRERASDLHISPEKEEVQVRFRIDGKLRAAPSPPKSVFPALVSRIKLMAQMDIANSRVPQDGRFTATLDSHEVNVRVSTIPTIYGENVVMRLLNMSGNILTLEELGMPHKDLEFIESAIRKPYGLVLSTGPTGSGKSTSLYAMLQSIRSPEINLITLEDPVEYRLAGIRQVQLNRKAGMTFASGLRSILRQDPDVIMVGEIRDGETAEISVQAALTGHLVFATLHTNDAVGAVARLEDMGIEPFLVSSVLLSAFAQRLVRRICKQCARPYHPNVGMLELFGLKPDEITYTMGAGCAECSMSGYKGRAGLFEVLKVDGEIQELITRRATPNEITKYAVSANRLSPLRLAAAEAIRQGKTTVEEAIRAVMA